MQQRFFFSPVFYFQFTCPPCNSRRAKQQAAAKKHESFDVGGAAGGGLMVPQQQVRRHSTGNPAAESAAVAAAAEAFKKKRGSAADIRQQQAAAAAGQQQQKQQQQQGGGASSRGAFMKRVNQVNRARLVPHTCKTVTCQCFPQSAGANLGFPAHPHAKGFVHTHSESQLGSQHQGGHRSSVYDDPDGGISLSVGPGGGGGRGRGGRGETNGNGDNQVNTPPQDVSNWFCMADSCCCCYPNSRHEQLGYTLRGNITCSNEFLNLLRHSK